MLEEPEVHEHPAAMRQSARAILAAIRRDIQIILSTHSVELIDALLAEAHNALLLARSEGLNRGSTFSLISKTARPVAHRDESERERPFPH